MSLLQLFPSSEFYCKVDSRELKPGHFCWIVAPMIDSVPRILDVERNSPEEHENTKFSIRNANSSKDFRTKDRTLPLKYLNLRSNEELLVQRAKRRLGIVLASEMDMDPGMESLLRRQGKQHLQEECRIVTPCYSVQKDGYGTGFPLEMTARIECLLYRQFFFCPADRGGISQSVVLFDRMQVVVGQDRHAIEGMGLSLSEGVFSLFRSMALFCLTGEQDEDLRAVREILKEAYEGGSPA